MPGNATSVTKPTLLMGKEGQGKNKLSAYFSHCFWVTLIELLFVTNHKAPISKEVASSNKAMSDKACRNKSVKPNPYLSGSGTTERPCVGQITSGWTLVLVRLAEFKSSHSISSEYTVGFKSDLAVFLWSTSKKLNMVYSTMWNIYSAIGMSPSKLRQK